MGTGRRTRRIGLLYLLLSVAGMAGAVSVTLRFDLRTAETIAALLPSLGGTYLSWATFRAGPREAEQRDDPAAVADRLAVAVRRQWEAEAAVRRLNDPYPLPVSWRPADVRFGEPPAVLREIAESWPGARSGARSGWAGEPAALAGTGGEIAEVFLERVPTRRLVVLGGPGSGKTMLLVRLLLALLADRPAGGPVPVLFSPASWNPAEQPLESWLAEQLARDYSGLGDPEAGAADRAGRIGRARLLLEHRLVLPVLDGFDEIPEPFRARALDAVNSALRPGQPLVLSSRAEEYGATLAPADGVPVRLSGAATVELRPLQVPDVAAYLRRDAGGGESADARWEPVVRLLGTDTPVARALTSPLMLFLARTVYNPRPGEGAAGLPDPADLCDRDRFPDPAAVRAHLFDAYVPAAYRPHPDHPCRWTPEQAEHALRQLARQLRGSTDLAWWQLRRVLPVRVAQVVTGLVLSVVAWVSATGAGRVTAYVGGLDSGWLTGPPAPMVAGLAGGIAGGIGCGLVAGVTGGVAEGLTHLLATGQAAWPATTTAGGLAYGFAGGIVGALSSRVAVQRSDSAARRWNWRKCALGFLTGAALWFSYRLTYGPRAALVGALLTGTVYAVAGGALGGRASSLSAHRAGAVPTVRTRWAWDWRGFGTGLACGSAIGVTHWAVLRVLGLLAGSSSYPLSTMLAFSCAFGLAVGLARGLTGKPADLTAPVAPALLLEQDRRIVGRLWAVVGLAVGAGFLLTYGVDAVVRGSLFYGLGRGTTDGRAIAMSPLHILDRGLAYGVTVGLAAALSHNAWWYHTLARHYLAVRRGLPRDLTAFLTDAHERHGVLRQTGAVHQFRHLDLQRHLAESDPPAGIRPRPPRPRQQVPDSTDPDRVSRT
ncbi:NACHT domain-containing protein [Streptomyces sp. Act143]|uniref:NACHT domain-containing protein n=1 Tax=Streptomyces sp. Act143 TaxID=2200760 RepID=UPI000D683415|nr:NACHT domain-containing protein [Streptomyces sp. Act143]PWI13681.1 NACHT domain-containing protein [Streptomyces sp. Act143]